MLALALFALLTTAPAGPLPSTKTGDGADRLAELGLTIDLGGLGHLEPVEASFGDLLAAWEGELGASNVRVQVVARPRDAWVEEPEDVVAMLAPTTVGDVLRALDRAGKRAKKANPGYLQAGPFGWVPYAAIKSTRVRVNAERVYDLYVLGGILEDDLYTIEVECQPPVDDAGAALIHQFLQNSVRYEGPLRNHLWTDEEVRRRWVSAARPEIHKDLEDPIRTEHYIVIGNGSGGAAFARHLEKCYDQIQKIYPFDEVPGRRLMPIFLMKTTEQYHDFLEDHGMPREDARQTAGVAMSDFYVTEYRSPSDPVHIHEAVHQIFGNRLRLNGGGSWFQEGVAEYVSSRQSERRAYAKPRAKDWSHVAFETFFTTGTLISGAGQDETRGSAARANYLQAASIIEFARDSRFGKKRFPAFLWAVGSLPPGSLTLIDEALLEVYEVDIAGFEKAWVDYWD